MSVGLLTLAGKVFNRRRDLVMCNRFTGSEPTKPSLSDDLLVPDPERLVQHDAALAILRPSHPGRSHANGFVAGALVITDLRLMRRVPATWFASPCFRLNRDCLTCTRGRRVSLFLPDDQVSGDEVPTVAIGEPVGQSR